MLFKKRTKEILSKFPEHKIALQSVGANFFGVESKGVKQVRGNGVLLLTDYELFFEMWWPKRILEIPIRDIIKVDNSKWHLKKTKSRPLVKVYFINKEGKEDSAAWMVRDLEAWTRIIENNIMKKG